MDKDANNISFICKNNTYVKVLLQELGLLNTTSNTYQQVNDTLCNVLQQQKIIQILFLDQKIMMRNLIVFDVLALRNA